MFGIGSVFALTGLLGVPSLVGARGTDAWITAKAKIALITTGDVSAVDVNVDTVSGLVTLHGKVPTEHVKERAGAVAKQIDGVRDVRNLLQVVEQGLEQETEVDDVAIEARVRQSLENDTSLRNSRITVQSVNDGVVLLGGHASSLGDHLGALNLAGQEAGVRRVASEIRSGNDLYDEGIWREGAVEQNGGVAVIGEAGLETPESTRGVGGTAKEAAEDLGATIADGAKAAVEASGAAAVAVGKTVKDVWITSAIKAQLVADDEVSAMDINVDTRDAVVTLFGRVVSATAKAAAEREARSISGVRDVRNEIEIAVKQKLADLPRRDRR
jgi:osmotically-inducible protein OsmY